jgi:hypothetical protein
VFFFTSDLPPSYVVASELRDGLPATTADIPVPNPEPSTFVMATIVVLLGFGIAWGVHRSPSGSVA